MASSQENRRHPRHPVGLKLEIPQLTEDSLSPENVSMGGMKVVVALKPSVGDHLLCTIVLKGIRYENCSAKVVWVQEIKDEEKILEAILQYPKILKRPIILNGEKGVIGRPPENILSIL